MLPRHSRLLLRLANIVLLSFTQSVQSARSSMSRMEKRGFKGEKKSVFVSMLFFIHIYIYIFEVKRTRSALVSPAACFLASFVFRNYFSLSTGCCFSHPLELFFCSHKSWLDCHSPSTLSPFQLDVYRNIAQHGIRRLCKTTNLWVSQASSFSLLCHLCPPDRLCPGCSLCSTVFEVTTRYVDLQPVGMGAFGLVCSAKDQLTATSVAIKKIMKPFSTPVLSKRTYRELKLLKHIRHENVRTSSKKHFYFTWSCPYFSYLPIIQIISLSDIFISPLEDIYFVTELLGTDLHRLLTSRPLEKQFIQYFLYQILRGLKYVHSAGVVHRDLVSTAHC